MIFRKSLNDCSCVSVGISELVAASGPVDPSVVDSILIAQIDERSKGVYGWNIDELDVSRLCRVVQGWRQAAEIH